MSWPMLAWSMTGVGFGFDFVAVFLCAGVLAAAGLAAGIVIGMCIFEWSIGAIAGAAGFDTFFFGTVFSSGAFFFAGTGIGIGTCILE
jgi:hypothetical protein